MVGIATAGGGYLSERQSLFGGVVFGQRFAMWLVGEGAVPELLDSFARDVAVALWLLLPLVRILLNALLWYQRVPHPRAEHCVGVSPGFVAASWQLFDHWVNGVGVRGQPGPSIRSSQHRPFFRK